MVLRPELARTSPVPAGRRRRALQARAATARARLIGSNYHRRAARRYEPKLKQAGRGRERWHEHMTTMRLSSGMSSTSRQCKNMIQWLITYKRRCWLACTVPVLADYLA